MPLKYVGLPEPQIAPIAAEVGLDICHHVPERAGDGHRLDEKTRSGGVEPQRLTGGVGALGGNVAGDEVRVLHDAFHVVCRTHIHEPAYAEHESVVGRGEYVVGHVGLLESAHVRLLENFRGVAYRVLVAGAVLVAFFRYDVHVRSVVAFMILCCGRKAEGRRNCQQTDSFHNRLFCR